MCELTAALMMGVSGARTVLGAAQEAQQAQIQAAQQSHRAWQASYHTAYQTAQARNAAAVSEYSAQDAERRGAVEEERQRRKTSLLQGSLLARLAAAFGFLGAAISRALRSISWAMPRRWGNRTRSPPAIRPHARHGPSGFRPPTRPPRPTFSPPRCRPGQPARIPVLASPVRCWAGRPTCSASPKSATFCRNPASIDPAAGQIRNKTAVCRSAL